MLLAEAMVGDLGAAFAGVTPAEAEELAGAFAPTGAWSGSRWRSCRAPPPDPARRRPTSGDRPPAGERLVTRP
ncbi:hypothetical protein A7K94_0203800 [Modestobacter sp. VKM Ac-2676]|nr:hypothetical protein A7K94_0203800 [Modestobacter sp. VKM Ac-2676]